MSKLRLAQYSLFRLALAALLPVLAALIQWLIWPYIPALTWLLFYPAVFFSAWIGGLVGGLLASLISLLLGLYIFVPPQFSWQVEDFRYAYSAVVFAIMGILFSVVHDRMQKLYLQLQRKNESNLSASQERLKLALGAANAGLWEWNLQTGRNEWSDELWRLYGLALHSLEPSYEAWLNTVHLDDRQAVVARLDEAVKSGVDLELEWRVANSSPGQERWLMSRGKAQFDEAGLPVLYRGIVLDITERKQLEQSLLNREQRLDFALTTLTAGAWDLNLQNHLASRTLQHDQIFGYSQLLPEWTYEMFLEHVLAEDREAVDRCFNQAIQNRTDWCFECRIRRTDGQIRWISAKGNPQTDEQGDILSLRGIVQDITERKHTEEQLSLRSSALEAAANGIVITDAQGVIEWVNPAFSDMTGYCADEAVGNTAQELFESAEHGADFYEKQWQILSAGKVWSGEIIQPP